MQTSLELILREDVSNLTLRDSAFAPTSWNTAARTFEVTVSTGADVQRQDARGPYIRTHRHESGLERLRGAPVLNAHKRSDVNRHFGLASSTCGRARTALWRRSG